MAMNSSVFFGQSTALAQELHVSFSAKRLVPIFYALDVGQTLYGMVGVVEAQEVIFDAQEKMVRFW